MVSEARCGLSKQVPDTLIRYLGLQVPQRAVERVAGGARTHPGLQGLPIQPAVKRVLRSRIAANVPSGVSP